MGSGRTNRISRMDRKFDRSGMKSRSREELEDLFSSPAIQALVKESREQFERGEYERIPIPEIKRRLRIGGRIVE